MTEQKEIVLEDKTFEIYLSDVEIAAITTHLADQLNKQYSQATNEVILVSILDGSFIFMADLVRNLPFRHQIQFVKLKSYDNMESSGEVEFVLDLKESVSGKQVLIIEDIIDTGLTIESFVTKLKSQNPTSMKVCTLLSKPEVHNDIIDIHFVGKDIPPEFVIGYGLDLNGYGRNLPHIYKLKI